MRKELLNCKDFFGQVNVPFGFFLPDHPLQDGCEKARKNAVDHESKGFQALWTATAIIPFSERKKFSGLPGHLTFHRSGSTVSNHWSVRRMPSSRRTALRHPSRFRALEASTYAREASSSTACLVMIGR